MILAAIVTFSAGYPGHGATGTWLDEILELGVPLVLFAGLWWWSTRKEKKKAKAAHATDRAVAAVKPEPQK
jgi:hypothetical protein